MESIDRGRTANETALVEGRNYSGGIDLARIHDFTVDTIVDSSIKQVYFDRFNEISWERQIGAIIEADKPFRPRWYVDSTGVGDPIYERLRNASLDVEPYPFTNASKGRLIDNLAMQMEQGKVRLMDIPQQENELIAYAYELTPARHIRMGAPAGMYDDCVTGLALACWGAGGAATYSAGAW